MIDQEPTTPHVGTVHLLGASGFVGKHVRLALEAEGLVVTTHRAPRLRLGARDVREVIAGIDDALVHDIRAWLHPGDVIVNVAGLIGGGDPDAFTGANALLPAALARTVASTGSTRLVHVSSAAVQGSSRTLTAAGALSPFNGYSRSKALGELAVQSLAPEAATCLRPASVHGRDRGVTRAVVVLASSVASTTLAPGTASTPQHHVENVAAAVRRLVTMAENPPPVVLQPDEGFTTYNFLMLMSGGRRPHLAPRRLGPLVSGLRGASARYLPVAGKQLRRLELMLRGQDQEMSWLTEHGFTGPRRHEAWIDMAEEVRAARRPYP